MCSSEQLEESIVQFGKALALWHERMAAEEGTTPARAKLLAILARCGPMKMNELSRELEVTPRNITKLVDPLEQVGLVTRVSHPSDRRATLVHVTPEGAALSRQWQQRQLDLQKAFDVLEADEQRTLCQLLNKLTRNLQNGNTKAVDPRS